MQPDAPTATCMSRLAVVQSKLFVDCSNAMPPGTDAPAPGGGQTLTLAGRADMRNPLGMIKKPPQLSQAKRDAPARALKGLEDAAAAAQDCIWQRVRTCMLTHVQLALH